LQAIENSKKTTLGKFLFSLGINEIGETTAQILANHFETLERILNCTDLENETTNISGIGKERAKSIGTFFNNETNRQIINRLIKNGIQFEEKAISVVENNSNIAGKIFVLTGTLQSMTREQAGFKIESLGGKLSNTLSKKTHYLIVGNEAGNKIAKAEKLGVQFIDEPIFLKWLENKD